MEFHGRTFDLINPADLAFDPDRGAAAERAASSVGITLPRAVVEWYCVREPSRLWEWYCEGCDCPAVMQPPGERSDGWNHAYVQDGSLVRDEHRGGWWVIPALRADLRGWVKGPILPLMYAHQGCWWWGVRLDGTADPPVVICEGDQGDVWDYHAASFSECVFARVFDQSLHYPLENGRTVHVEGHLSAQQQQSLREDFRVEPTLRYENGLFSQRFSRAGQRFNLLISPTNQYSTWRLWARSSAEFGKLVGLLSRACKSLEGVMPGDGPPLYVREGTTAADVNRNEDQIPF